MKLKNLLCASPIVLIALLATVPLATAQVPCGPVIVPKPTLFVDWPHYHFDAALTGCNPYESILTTANVGNLTLDWQFPVVQGVPVVANGAAFMGGGGSTLYALNANTGAILWSYQPGPYGLWDSAAAVANGVVYLGFNDGQYGQGGIYAFKAGGGPPLWRNPIEGTGPLTVANGMVYFAWGAVDAATGVTKWLTGVGDLLTGPPAVANGRSYVGSHYDYTLYALDAVTGAPIWSYPTAGYIDSTATVAAGVVYIGSGDNNLYALDAATGDFRWAYLTGGAVGSPVVATGVVYFGSADLNLYAVNASTGALIWKYQIGSVPSLAVANGVLYAANADSLWAFNAKRALLHAYDAYLPQTSPAVTNGKVYVGTYDSLWVFHLPGQ